MWWILLFLPLLIIPIRLMICRNQFIKIFVEQKYNYFGVQIFRTIYTLTSAIQSKRFICFDFVLIKRQYDRIVVRPLYPFFEITIPLEYVKPGFQLHYEVDGKIRDLPYEEGTPFQVKQGELVLRERIRRRLGFVMKEVARSREWPFPSKVDSNQCDRTR